MSAIIKLHTRRNKNSLLQHSSRSVQTQDFQISLKTRNIFCLAWRDCLIDAPAHGPGGEAAAPSAGNWKGSTGAGLPPAPSGNASLLSAEAATRGTAAQTCSNRVQQSLATVYSGKTGLLLPRDCWGCCQELGQLSADHFTGVTGKSSYRGNVIFAELIEIPILRFFSHKYFWQCSTSEIFSSLLMSRRCCTAAKHPRADPRTQHWTSVERMHQLRVTKLCVFSSGNPHKAMNKISMKLCLNN